MISVSEANTAGHAQIRLKRH